MLKISEKTDQDTLNKLAELDRKGFILPSGTTANDFIKSAENTTKWAEGINENLREEGMADVMGEEFSAEQAVPGEILIRCLKPARDRYGINPDWVPAFFSKDLLPWYVGGACIYFFGEDNSLRVCFVLSERFRNRSKWLLYSRKEIISHEICHVARAGLGQNIFEEPLAYHISESALRRALGPMFRDSWEASSVLAGSFLLLVGSFAHTFGAPRWIPWLTSIPLLAVAVILGGRAFKGKGCLKKTIDNLKPFYGNNAESVAFRCTDEEIEKLAKTQDTDKTLKLCKETGKEQLRWEVIDYRFSQ